MKKRIFAIALLTVSATVAQGPDWNTGIVPIPREPVRQWEQLQQFLALTPAQLDALEKSRQARMQEEQSIYQQVAEKQRQMYQLLQQGSNDASTIGRLMVEVNNLNRSIPQKKAPYRAQALAVLTDAQKAKLATLLDAMKLQAPAWQAVELNMIDNPHVPDVRILPAPLAEISATEPGDPGNRAAAFR
jgi:Spy/CpxP family protein refolding chaperone